MEEGSAVAEFGAGKYISDRQEHTAAERYPRFSPHVVRRGRNQNGTGTYP